MAHWADSPGEGCVHVLLEHATGRLSQAGGEGAVKVPRHNWLNDNADAPGPKYVHELRRNCQWQEANPKKGTEAGECHLVEATGAKYIPLLDFADCAGRVLSITEMFRPVLVQRIPAAPGRCVP